MEVTSTGKEEVRTRLLVAARAEARPEEAGTV
jgi:hypothetical protein